MKTSLKKLRSFGLLKHESKQRLDLRPLAQLDELAQASRDMEQMRDCYDSLLSAAAATENSAYEFSVSLQEMGACLLEKTSLNGDEDSGKVLQMLGKAQFELQKLVDRYRSHISQTITRPSESLLNQLRTVEEMKRQCDEKREVYEYMRQRHKEKGRSKIVKGESFTLQQLQTAREEYNDEATLFVFRLKSLKQGQSHSLLTQAARHHAAQLCFFKKALQSLEAVDPHVKSLTEQQHIDYCFSGLEDENVNDGNNDGVDDDDGDDECDDGELSFDYGQNNHDQDILTLQNFEVDQPDLAFHHVEAVKENLDRNRRNSFSFGGTGRIVSQSAPLFPERKFDAAERIKQMHLSSTQKFHTYVLPTPADTKGSISEGPRNPVPNTTQRMHQQNLWRHSSPLESRKYDKLVGDENVSGHAAVKPQSVLKESNTNASSTQLPPPLSDGLPRHSLAAASDAKKIKRQAFSGPLIGKASTNKPVPIENPQLFSGPLLRNPIPQPLSSSPKSPVASPTFISSPKINELHELPRPPISSTYKSSRPSGLVGHSAPLVSKSQGLSTATKTVIRSTASPLPMPPLQTITRSFSIPSRSPRETATLFHEPKPLETVRSSEIAFNTSSPPLTPLTLSNNHGHT